MSNDLKSPIFKTPQVDIIFSHKNMSCGLNLSQKMTDKIQNESGHFDNTIMRKQAEAEVVPSSSLVEVEVEVDEVEVGVEVGVKIGVEVELS